MKKLHVIAMADRREALLKGLLHLGCVEISQPEEVLSDPEWAALFRRSETLLTQRKAELTDVDTALAAIGQYAKLKNGLFIKRHPITEAEFLDAGAAEQAKAACEAVREQLGVLMQAKTEEGHIASQIAALTPWRELDLPLEQTGTAIRFSAWASVPDRRTPAPSAHRWRQRDLQRSYMRSARTSCKNISCSSSTGRMRSGRRSCCGPSASARCAFRG